ncbi:MAG TPA: arylsulfotransferase family protein [Solirubrobacteraceae bacterium]|nr:arylsulfotransferase family protein [Solirubrobacteraceae bacterium]
MTIRMRTTQAAACCLACVAGALVLAACGNGSSVSSAVVTGDAWVKSAASNPVAVSPMPGTPDASASTQISFLGDAGTSVSGVRVLGSRSGAHSGVLRGYSTGTGESFLPRHPFTPGERVTVTARVSTQTGSGLARTTFTVARPYSPSSKRFPTNPGDARAIQHYSSAPTLTPSTVRITTPAKPGAAPGDLFMAPYQGKGTPGPMIVDQAGNLVWFHPLPAGKDATNFQVQQLDGKPVLTWWQGRILQVGFGQGENVIYDTAYKQVGVVRAGNGYHADLHEIQITPQGTAWIDAFAPIRMNLASVHGLSNGILTDSIVQEIDIKTGLVMWEWHALGHVPVSESNNAVPKSSYPWDYVHVNSIDPGPTGQEGGAGSSQLGDVLLSARNTWAVYDVDIHSGGVRWRLGGRRSSFKLGPGTRFYWQHDAQFQPGGLISLFDNGADPPKERQSRGLLIDANTSTHTAALVKQLTNPAKTLLATSQGNTLGLPGGNWLMGYGGLPNFTEYSSSGGVLLDGTLGKNVQSFRTYLSPWSGRAPGAPAVVARSGVAGTLTVSVSWNGATEVASWRVLAGSAPGALSPVASAPKVGFQTTIAAPTVGPYVQVQALDGAGAVIGTSAAVKG